MKFLTKFSILFLIVEITIVLSIGLFLADTNLIFGNDFFDFYNASQAAFIEGISPYSETVTLRNQLGVYGQPALPGQDQLAFNYPPYALLPFLPLSFLPLKWAQSIWVAFMFSTLLVLPLAAFPRIPRWAWISSFFIYPISFSLLLGNYAVLLGTLLIFVIGYLLFSENASPGMDIFAGVLLAFTTIKPQFSALFLLILLLAVLRFKRWQLLISFFGSFLVFITFSFILLPSWPLAWYQQLFRYVESNQAIPHVTILLQFIMKPGLANTFTLIITGLLFAVLGWLGWQWWKGKLPFLKLLAFTGFFAYFIHPRTVSYEQIVFLVPFLVWIFSNPEATPGFHKLIFYLGSIVISWVGFAANKAGWEQLFPLEWIFLFYLIWMVYFFITPKNAVHLKKHDSTDL